MSGEGRKEDSKGLKINIQLHRNTEILNMEALLQRRPFELAKGLDKVSGSYLTFKQDKNSVPPFLALEITTFPVVP